MNEQWQKFLDRATEWLIAFGPRIALAVIALVAGIWMIRLMNRWLKNVMKRRHFDPSLQPFLLNLFQVILTVLLIIGIMQILGIQMTVFAAMIAALTVAAGLALSGTLQNFANGILILIQRPFRVGDTIITQGTEGSVTSIRLFYTVVLTYDNKTIYIPNGQLSNNVIVNLSREGKRRMDIEMKFGYSTNIDDIKKILMDTVIAHEHILKQPAPRIGVSTLEADKFVVVLNLWTAAHGFQDLKLEIHETIIKALQSRGYFQPKK